MIKDFIRLMMINSNYNCKYLIDNLKEFVCMNDARIVISVINALYILCICIYTYIYIYKYIHAYIHTYIHTYIHAHNAYVIYLLGKLKKGGIANTDASARSVLHDWNNGKIKYYCRAPKMITSDGSSSVDHNSGDAINGNGGKRIIIDKDDKIVSAFSDSLDINQLRDADMRVIADLYPTSSSSDSIGIEESELFIGMDSIGESMDIKQ